MGEGEKEMPDITVYDGLYNGLKKYLSKRVELASLCHYAPKNPTFPLVIFDEINNVRNSQNTGTRQEVSTLFYKVEIYAKNIAGKDKQTMAREVFKWVDRYLAHKMELHQFSYNVSPNLGKDGSLYRITVMYQCKYLVNRQIIY